MTRRVLELDHVVRAQDTNSVAVLAFELAQPALVRQAGAAVLLHHPLIETQAGRAAWPL